MEADHLELASLELGGPQSTPAAESLRSALAAIQGVYSVDCAPGASAAVVSFDPCRVKPRQLRLAARVVGCTVVRIVLPGTAALAQPGDGPARLLVAGA